MSLLEAFVAPQEVSLRPAGPRDARHLARWRAEPSVRRYQPLSPLTSNQLRSDLAQQNLAQLYRGKGEKFQWIVEADGVAAGWITLVILNWEHGLGEIGYALSSSFQGRGLMTRALRLLISDLYSRTSLERIEARCALENRPSQRVLEKAGFRREGLLRRYFKLRGTRVDNYLYALLRHEPASTG